MKVILTPDTWQRMKAYVDNCQEEISGLGKIERTAAGDYRIIDLALFQQDVSAAHSDITSEQLAKFQLEMHRRDESLEDWCFWWHSHAKMEVFFSATDTKTIDSSTEFPYLVSLVTNHAHDFKARVDVFQYARMYMEVPVVIEEHTDSDVVEACKAEIQQKVKRTVARPNTNVSTGRGTWNGVHHVINGLSDDEIEDMYNTHHELPTPNQDPPPSRATMSLDEIRKGLQSNDDFDELFIEAFNELEDKILDWENVLETAQQEKNAADTAEAEAQLEVLNMLFDQNIERYNELTKKIGKIQYD